MNLLRPNQEEDFDNFLVRFINDHNAIIEFPDENQRIQIALTIFDTENFDEDDQS